MLGFRIIVAINKDSRVFILFYFFNFASFGVFFQKLHVFLFTELLVLTRPVTRNERHCFQVYRQPIPVQDLVLEDLQDGDVRMGGSFRGAFGNADKGEGRERRRSSARSQTQTSRC